MWGCERERSLLTRREVLKTVSESVLAVTTNAEDGYPVYRRRDKGGVVNVGGALLDNRWVVPYNPCSLLYIATYLPFRNTSLQ